MAGKIKISAKANHSVVEIQNPLDWQREAHKEQKIHMFNSKRSTTTRISSIAKSFSPPLLLPSTKNSHAKTSNLGKNSHEASIKYKTHHSIKYNAPESIKIKQQNIQVLGPTNNHQYTHNCHSSWIEI
ncbi:hypothetical protein KSP39_PZI017617 [Platanthera zijinensis]|uniref:Uncharacterized protein n=1 Tax=Platanthera zijinensis TaxID=2320716 RepID=A0AAP0G031_9ASPA